MKILLINQDWFAAEWRAQGHEVLVATATPEQDLLIDAPLMPVTKLCGEFKPDRIIVHDNSSPIMVSGLEDVDVPTVFYSVDAQHHSHYHRFLAGTFDLTFVAQKDYIPKYIAQGHPTLWLPLWASRVVDASDEKKYGAVFVGTMDPKLNPDRVAFFNELKNRVPLVIERGEYWKIFPHSEIVVNQTVKGDLNFRVFEVMMCGSMLLTENSGNGLEELFVPGKHLVTYSKGNVEEAAAKITEYLGDLERCREIAAAGRVEIVAKHLPIHRAQTVMGHLESLTKRESNQRYFGMLVNYATVSIGFESIERSIAIAALLRALRCAEIGLQKKELITHEIGCHAVLSAIRYDQKVPGRIGAQLLRKLHAGYPELAVLALGVIREHLNHGEREQAQAMTQFFNVQSPEEVFSLAERLVSDLLARVA